MVMVSLGMAYSDYSKLSLTVYSFDEDTVLLAKAQARGLNRREAMILLSEADSRSLGQDEYASLLSALEASSCA